jgi:hypothetical protein
MQVASGASGSLLVIEAVGNGVILKVFQRVRKEWEAALWLAFLPMSIPWPAFCGADAELTGPLDSEHRLHVPT